VTDDMPELDRWANFYLIVGPSAGALIGLQFVVMTLLADMPVTGVDAQAGGAFTTPSVVHFVVVLLLSAVGTGPWDAVAAVATLWGLVGLGGVAYVAIVARRLRSQTAYRPVFEDWLFHVLLPLAAYTALVVSACTAYLGPRLAPFLVGAVALALLFVGIHNAWDLVTYQVFVRRRELREAERNR
jgi:hypothetical protein